MPVVYPSGRAAKILSGSTKELVKTPERYLGHPGAWINWLVTKTITSTPEIGNKTFHQFFCQNGLAKNLCLIFSITFINCANPFGGINLSVPYCVVDFYFQL